MKNMLIKKLIVNQIISLFSSLVEKLFIYFSALKVCVTELPIIKNFTARIEN